MKIVFKLWIIVSITACDNSPKFIEKYDNLSYDQLVSELGNPSSEADLKLYEDVKLYEYQSSLYKITSNINEGDTLEIRQMIWENKYSTLVIWCRLNSNEWESFDNLKWNSLISF